MGDSLRKYTDMLKVNILPFNAGNASLSANQSALQTIDVDGYPIVIPMSVVFAAVAFILCCLTLVLIVIHRRLHTVNHLLIGNTCVWSIFYCCAQSNHFIYLLFVPWDTGDMSCRWRGFFAYMTITGVMYSYLLQAMSRLFFIVLIHKYRWTVSFKFHQILIFVQWIAVIMLTLPAIGTKDIFFRPHELCWVSRIYTLHIYYTFAAYYAMPTALIIVIYVYVYYQTKFGTTEALRRARNHGSHHRDFEVFRNILILFGIYLCGGLPASIYILTNIDIFYWIGIVFMPLTLTMEKCATFYLNRELLNILKTRIYRITARVVPAISHRQ